MIGGDGETDWEEAELTGGKASVGFDLQLLDLFDQQGDVLQEVRVLLQQPLNSDLGVIPSIRLHQQLLLENVDLRKPARTSQKTNTEKLEAKGLCDLFEKALEPHTNHVTSSPSTVLNKPEELYK